MKITLSQKLPCLNYGVHCSTVTEINFDVCEMLPLLLHRLAECRLGLPCCVIIQAHG